MSTGGLCLPYLEGQVLEEVRGAVGLVGLGPRPGIDPDADGRRLGPRRVLGGDLRVGESACRAIGALFRSIGAHTDNKRTVRPFFNVVVCVLPTDEAGVAKPLLRPAEMGARLRNVILRESEEVVDAVELVGHEVDTPEAVPC